ncbi:hypothetical protein CR938_09980 [Pseudoxanthomonas taiwanensis]|mgnify:CR=1 FL=1|uniref:Toxin CptA n=1 Tax=Pseudoxanthomonas taiwanensis TaxID=176598 RepID=A0A921TFG8_9GAMM|nr:hypothetical protein CR938_09980 [Pseudoxanthomonas taiwanensis]
MPSSTRSSRASARFRREWRPSRLLHAGLLALTVLASLAVLGSGLPRPWAWPLALVALAWGAAVAWRYARAPVRRLVLHADGGELDGRPLRDWAVAWRGPLAFLRLHGQDGRILRLAWWPDTLPPPARRELRLAALARAASRGGAAVAP